MPLEARAEILTEAYAQAFSRFATTAETLRALRPSIWGFFRDRRAKLDKAAAAAAKKAAATP